MIDTALAEAALAQPTPARLKDGVLTLTCLLPASQSRVWAALTEPELLAGWSPVVPHRTLAEAGPVTSREDPGDEPVDATVIESRGPWFLEHRWGPDRLTWQLAPSGDQTQVNLVHELADAEAAADMAAGWHLCLTVLARRLAGVETARCVGRDALDHGWAQLRDGYRARFAQAAAARG